MYILYTSFSCILIHILINEGFAIQESEIKKKWCNSPELLSFSRKKAKAWWKERPGLLCFFIILYSPIVHQTRTHNSQEESQSHSCFSAPLGQKKSCVLLAHLCHFAEIQGLGSQANNPSILGPASGPQIEACFNKHFFG